MLTHLLPFVFLVSTAVAAPISRPELYASRSSQWMKYIKGTTRLTELSLPGTHDSGAFGQPVNALDSTLEGMNAIKAKKGGIIPHLPFDLGGKVNKANVDTQILDITDQLNSGIRALDIRAGIATDSNDAWVKWHGEEPILLKPTDLSYMPLHQYIFQPVVNFLKRRPSETVVMLLQIDRITGTYTEQDLTAYILKYISKNRQSFYIWDPWTRRAPTLDTVRGKISFICQYDCTYTDRAGRRRTLGPRLQYLGNTDWDSGKMTNSLVNYSVQDAYDRGGSSDDDKDVKVSVVVNQLTRALSRKVTNTLFVNFASASVFGITGSGTPAAFAAWVNPRITNIFKAAKTGTTGIVFSDFVDLNYVRNIILAGKQPWI